MEQLAVNNVSLLIVSALVIISMLISRKESLGLEKDIIISSVRAVVQLFAVGYLLRYIFQKDNGWVTFLIVAFMVLNATYHAHTRSSELKHSFLISLIAISSATAVSLAVLVLSKTIDWTAQQVIPITGMIASNAMVIVGLAYSNLHTRFEDQRQQVLEKLSLGATPLQASHSVLRDSTRMAMQPNIDSAKTVGLVSLPGMMTGLMFAGVDPLLAIRYQIVITFLMLGISAITSILTNYLSYRQFFNDRAQLLI